MASCARRLFGAIITVAAVTTVSFLIMRATPGGPFDAPRELPPEVLAKLREHYHLDWPAWRQLAQYIGPINLGPEGPTWLGGDGTRPWGGVLTGDFGPSTRYRDYSVGRILAESLPVSLTLGGVSLALALLIGGAGGVACSLLRGGAFDGGVRLVATVAIALPNFVVAGLLVLLFSFTWHLLPPAGWGAPRHLILPALALAAPYGAAVARLLRTALLEVLAADHIRTARAKGVGPLGIVLRHALREASLPVLSTLGPAAAGILTGSLVIEQIFHIPGTGSHFVQSALNRDYTLALGVTVLYTTLITTFNAAVDLLYGLVDPRLREQP